MKKDYIFSVDNLYQKWYNRLKETDYKIYSEGEKDKMYQGTLDMITCDKPIENTNTVVKIDTDGLHKQLSELGVKSETQNTLIPSKHRKELTNPNKSHTAASPIRSLEEIDEIKEYLLNRPERYKGTNIKYYTYFVMAINNVLRISDLSQIRIGDLLHTDGSLKDKITLTEKKTGKTNTIYLNDSIKSVIPNYLRSLGVYSREDYLFSPRGKSDKPMSRQAFWNILNEIKNALDLDYTLSCHSTRKTFVYQSLMKNKDKYVYILTLLQRMLNHSKQETTIRYCGLEEDDKREVYNTLCL